MRRLVGLVSAGAFTVFALFSAVLLIDGWQAFGQKASGARLERMQASPQWSDGAFDNPQPMWNDTWGMVSGWADGSDVASPDGELPVVTGDRSRFAQPPQSGLRITWLGHSTSLIEIDGVTLLLDPVWGERASPFDWVGPKRWYAPPIPLSELPPVDAVLISHDHYDHLDWFTFQQLRTWENTRFIVPLGVASHLEYWGVPVDQIDERDWWDSVSVGDVTVHIVPSRHASGRFLTDYMSTLWCGFAAVGPTHRVYYSGDTGMFQAMAEIGERFGPFDVTMIEVGAYNAAWPDWHIGPEQAVRAHELMGGKVFLPVHWGMFDLALHGWTEPAERVVAAARATGTTLAMPRPGESIEPMMLAPEGTRAKTQGPFEKWWPEVPWQTAAEHPIVSRELGDLDTSEVLTQ